MCPVSRPCVWRTCARVDMCMEDMCASPAHLGILLNTSLHTMHAFWTVGNGLIEDAMKNKKLVSGKTVIIGHNVVMGHQVVIGICHRP